MAPSDNLKYLYWPDFIKTVYIGVKEISPLKENRTIHSTVVSGYKGNTYEPLQVIGDWMYVRCWSDCEGCENMEAKEGWVRWRDKKTLLVDIAYIC